MTRWTRVLAAGVGLAALAGCAGGPSRPAPGSSAAPARRMIMIGRGVIDPADVTIGTAETVGFTSTADQPLHVEFVTPSVQAGKINCRLAGPERLERGHAPGGEGRTGGNGHLRSGIPPRGFRRICSFPPGSYSIARHDVD